MKDTMCCQHSLSDDVVYKEVVVIGNGPSGMVTSFMLAGNVPYLKEIPADLPLDDMLRARLSNLPKGQSLYETDLLALAEGLEGRGQNPIPLLMDNLLRPCADMGITADSLIEWKYDVEKQIDHIVLGRGPPGGAWHTFPASVRTLSPGAWLALPPHASAGAGRLPATSVARYCRRYVQANNLTRYFRSGVVVGSVSLAPAAAAPCARRCPRAALYAVAGYDMCEGRPFRFVCRRVVLACGGGDRPNTLEPRLAAKCLHALGTIERALEVLAAAKSANPAVLVVGSGVSAADAVCAAARKRLHVSHLHRAPPDALARLDATQYPDYCQVYKMMCDGSAGDYKHYTSYPEHVIVDITPEGHDPTLPRDLEVDYEAIRPKRVKLLNLVTNQLLEVTVSVIAVLIGSKPDLFFLQTNFNLNSIDLEPDCIKCTEKKNAKKKIEDERRQCFLRNHWLYIKSVLGQSIQSCKSRYLNYSEINGNSNVPDKNNCITKENTCACADVQIKTDASKYEIIPDRVKCQCQCQPINPYSNGIGFGVDPKKPVDGRSNPIAIDKSTHELLNAPEGIYALGPLTADNFVRFIPGGALAIAAHVHRERKATAE